MILNQEEFETECEIGLELYVDSCMLNQSNIVESMLLVNILARDVVTAPPCIQATQS